QPVRTRMKSRLNLLRNDKLPMINYQLQMLVPRRHSENCRELPYKSLSLSCNRFTLPTMARKRPIVDRQFRCSVRKYLPIMVHRSGMSHLRSDLDKKLLHCQEWQTSMPKRMARSEAPART